MAGSLAVKQLGGLSRKLILAPPQAVAVERVRDTSWTTSNRWRAAARMRRLTCSGRPRLRAKLRMLGRGRVAVKKEVKDMTFTFGTWNINKRFSARHAAFLRKAGCDLLAVQECTIKVHAGLSGADLFDWSQ